MAWLLLGDVVPGSLSLPHVDVAATFGAQRSHDAARYERFVNWDWVLSQIVLVAVLAAYARYGVRYAQESAAGRIGTGMLLGMLGLALVWLVQLPFRVAGHWWDRRHHLTTEGYLSWAFGDWAALGVAFLSLCAALLIVMAIAGKLPRLWWLPGACVFVGLMAFFQLVIPYALSLGTHPLRDPEVLARARVDEQKQGLPNIPLRVENVSDFTDAANAYAVGIGPSRRIVLWDTLLDHRYTLDEVDVVLAHELGHHSSKHLLKAIGWFGLFALPGTFLVALATRRRGGMMKAEAVPLGLLVVTVLNLAATPAQAWLSRRAEAEADWKALQTTRDPDAMKSLFVKFGKDDLSDPSPPTWAYLLLENHPTLEQRVAMAEAWAARNGG